MDAAMCFAFEREIVSERSAQQAQHMHWVCMHIAVIIAVVAVTCFIAAFSFLFYLPTI